MYMICCISGLENLKYIVEDGGRTTTHEMITDNPSTLNPDPEIINTAETGGNDTNLHQVYFLIFLKTAFELQDA